MDDAAAALDAETDDSDAAEAEARDWEARIASAARAAEREAAALAELRSAAYCANCAELREAALSASADARAAARELDLATSEEDCAASDADLDESDADFEANDLERELDEVKVDRIHEVEISMLNSATITVGGAALTPLRHCSWPLPLLAWLRPPSLWPPLRRPPAPCC